MKEKSFITMCAFERSEKGMVFKMEKKFVKLKGKERKDKKIYSQEQISAPDFTDDYGRLVPPGYVVFDFDAQPYIDIISNIINNLNLKCKKLTTTLIRL